MGPNVRVTVLSSNRDGRRGLIRKGRDGMVIVTAVCEDRGHQTDASEQSEECLTHKNSQE